MAIKTGTFLVYDDFLKTKPSYAYRPPLANHKVFIILVESEARLNNQRPNQLSTMPVDARGTRLDRDPLHKRGLPFMWTTKRSNW